ncbi:hypothetical protein B0J17DRAFT_623996 [Rhizoctonia solani]|nr:hypothetical protein B0J17DRAFT_623996 [Rhizoctonia solani]
MRNFTAYVNWPSEHIVGLIETALRDICTQGALSKTAPEEHSDPGLLLQWTTYDSLVHSLTLEYPDKVLTSSYNIRKALIRKHFLHQTISSYLTKTPDCILRKAMPQTWPIDISFADDLDDAWADELWDLSVELEKGNKWFILKPGMDDSSDEESAGSAADTPGNSKTTVMISQLRHFVIQSIVSGPNAGEGGSIGSHPFQGFAPRSQASGALKLFMSPNILTLFAGAAYISPSSQPGEDPNEMDLSAHLTNTALQDDVHESSIRLLRELIGCDILSTPNSDEMLRLEDVRDIEDQVSNILAETFKAALASAVHFQVLPNAFELFGVDFLVTHAPEHECESSKFQVHLLEINAEPAIELTGARLNWILVDLFKGIAHTCVKPFFEDTKPTSNIDQANQWLRKCLDIETRKYW